MASLANDPSGTKRILFVDGDGKRKSLRLGKMSKRQAETIKHHLEDLLSAKLSASTPSDKTGRWLAEIEDSLREKLANLSLAESREKRVSPPLKQFVEGLKASKGNLKPNTIKNYDQTIRRLVDYFGEDCPLESVDCGSADQWKDHLLKSGLAPATVGREVKRARQFFRAAMRRKLVSENPFTEVSAPAQVNTARGFFVTREITDKVLAACPDVEWQLIVVLSRYGGLRCPSEHLALRWGDIDWENNRISVPSPKTEHLPGGSYRTVPLFPELRPYLETAFDQAEPGTEFVINRYRCKNQNLRTQFQRILRRAGVKSWERLFHNLRASRETELTEKHPLHVVCDWIGNSAVIASRHYLQVTDDHFAKALEIDPDQSGAECGALSAKSGAQNAAQHSAADRSKEVKEAKRPCEYRANVHPIAVTCSTVQEYSIPRRGVEPLSPP